MNTIIIIILFILLIFHGLSHINLTFPPLWHQVAVHKLPYLCTLQLFVTDEDPRGQNVSLKSAFAKWMLKKVNVQFNAVAWASTTLINQGNKG